MSSSANPQPVTRADLDVAVDRLDTKIDALDAKISALDAKTDALDAKIDTKTDALDAKIEALDTKTDAMERRLSRHVSAEISRSLGFVEERFRSYFDLAMERLDAHCTDARLHPALEEGQG